MALGCLICNPDELPDAVDSLQEQYSNDVVEDRQRIYDAKTVYARIKNRTVLESRQIHHAVRTTATRVSYRERHDH